jgi:biopolymer transport protein ExbB/TolQ
MIPIQLTPILASGALQFAFEKATTEGKITIGVLITVSLFSWSVIITKIFQLARVSTASTKFMEDFKECKTLLDLPEDEKPYEGSPAFELFYAGREELKYQLERATVKDQKKRMIGGNAFDSVRVALEEAAMRESMALEKGMIVLSTAVAGGPFIGLLGTVWGVMETFSSIAKANAASLTTMAPGVAGALIATVIGLMVAIPAMFAYNFMVTRIRNITQELDSFSIRLATQIEHLYVEDRSLEDEIADAVVKAMKQVNEASIR